MGQCGRPKESAITYPTRYLLPAVVAVLLGCVGKSANEIIFLLFLSASSRASTSVQYCSIGFSGCCGGFLGRCPSVVGSW